MRCLNARSNTSYCTAPQVLNRKQDGSKSHQHQEYDANNDADDQQDLHSSLGRLNLMNGVAGHLCQPPHALARIRW